MNINFFQISLLLISIAIIFYAWKKNRLVANFLLGALILIALSCLNFLHFTGTLDTLTIAYMTFSFVLLNAGMLIRSKKNIYIYLTVIFLLLTIFLFLVIDSGEHYEKKLGVVVRIFLAFFPANLWYLNNRKD